jgi:hypothetical protein
VPGLQYQAARRLRTQGSAEIVTILPTSDRLTRAARLNPGSRVVIVHTTTGALQSLIRLVGATGPELRVVGVLASERTQLVCRLATSSAVAGERQACAGWA